jgi:hypothetical protein
MTSNPSQNSHCLQQQHHRCCCKAASYHIYWTNDWCDGIPRNLKAHQFSAMRNFELRIVSKSSVHDLKPDSKNKHCLQPHHHICYAAAKQLHLTFIGAMIGVMVI